MDRVLFFTVYIIGEVSYVVLSFYCLTSDRTTFLSWLAEHFDELSSSTKHHERTTEFDLFKWGLFQQHHDSKTPHLKEDLWYIVCVHRQEKDFLFVIEIDVYTSKLYPFLLFLHQTWIIGVVVQRLLCSNSKQALANDFDLCLFFSLTDVLMIKCRHERHLILLNFPSERGLSSPDRVDLFYLSSNPFQRNTSILKSALRLLIDDSFSLFFLLLRTKPKWPMTDSLLFSL